MIMAGTMAPPPTNAIKCCREYSRVFPSGTLSAIAYPPSSLMTCSSFLCFCALIREGLFFQAERLRSLTNDAPSKSAAIEITPNYRRQAPSLLSPGNVSASAGHTATHTPQ